MDLNARARRVVDAMLGRRVERRFVVHTLAGGGIIFDCGSRVPGGLRTGLDLARVCMADLAEVTIVPGTIGGRSHPHVQVTTDHPVAACLASQYAGWALQHEKFFAMGSGPMRAAANKEPLFEKIGFREDPEEVVGVLETRSKPTPDIIAKIAQDCRVSPEHVTLLVAPTASLAGGIQIVARSVETALHKLVELNFDVARVVSAIGSAPVAPVAKDDLAAIGRTNDAILYGAQVTLYVTGDDRDLEAIGPQVPSTSSKDHGEPFSAIFARYNHDFYAVDPHLFSPAEVVFQNIESGRTHVFGRMAHDVLARSFV
jgi:methenyltetrahydromethanopterin cyclohydrolase